MHEIKRLIAEKEKCFALNQKTISSSNGTKLTSFHVSDQSKFVTELDANPVSGIFSLHFTLTILEFYNKGVNTFPYRKITF